jgi:hypothetical protein
MIGYWFCEKSICEESFTLVGDFIYSFSVVHFSLYEALSF